MTKILDEVLAANTKHAENFGDKGNLPLPFEPPFRDSDLHGCPP